MSTNIPTLYVSQFGATVELALQQIQSKLAGTFRQHQCYGKQSNPVDQVGSVNASRVTTRGATLVPVNAAFTRRWVVPIDFEIAQHIDSFDKLKLLLDPTSAYVQNTVAALNRSKDDVMIAAFFADAVTGETGSATTAYDATYDVDVNFESSTNCGLTALKLIEALRILAANEVDLESEPVFCAISSKQHSNLLHEAYIVNADYTRKFVLDKGRVTEFGPIKFIHSERLSTDGSSYRRVPLWVPSGMCEGVWANLQTSVEQRDDLSGKPIQVYGAQSVGATRTDEKKVIEIKCAE